MTTEATIPVRARIGQNVRVLLRARKKPIRELAEHLGRTESSVYAKLAGDTGFSAEEIEAIAEFLDCHPGDLFRRSILDLQGRQSECRVMVAGQMAFDFDPPRVIELTRRQGTELALAS